MPAEMGDSCFSRLSIPPRGMPRSEAHQPSFYNQLTYSTIVLPTTPTTIPKELAEESCPEFCSLNHTEYFSHRWHRGNKHALLSLQMCGTTVSHSTDTPRHAIEHNVHRHTTSAHLFPYEGTVPLLEAKPLSPC